MSTRPVLLALLLLAPFSAAGAAESPIEAARALIARYDQDPARIDRARDVLEGALQQERQVDAMVLLARVYFLYGDVRAQGEAAKLDAYDRGREIARRAIELAPRNAHAHLWYATNMGRWGQTKGVVRSLFLLPTMREELDTIFNLDPNLPGAYALAGNVLMEVPALFGGDRAKAEERFKKGLELDPRFTAIRVDLARLYVATGRRADARRELERVLEERTPTSIADWTVKDVPRARKLLESLRGA
jgi:thioredoxin-like negative regulator of GroEL